MSWIGGAACAALLGLAAAAPAPGAPPQPIPEGPEASTPEEFIGSPATPESVPAPEVPRHPFMAPNGDSVIHDDAYMTDTYTRSGPLGMDMERRSTFLGAECASLTFDSEGRIVTICVGLEGPRLVMLDADTLEQLAVFPLPPRIPGGGDPFSDFSGGGYFYLDHRDRAVIPTNNREIWVVRETSGPGFALERRYDGIASKLGPQDKINSALPDWDGRIWFVSTEGVVGAIRRGSGEVRVRRLGEGITNSFSVDEDGGVYIVSDRALYRFDADGDGEPDVTWRKVYPNSGQKKPGQVDDGSGTTPTLMGGKYVSITDNADPMAVIAYRRARHVDGPRRVCRQPVFEQGASATDNSLIGTRRAMVVENNFGYSGPTATTDGKSTSPGIERVDIDRDGFGCDTVWESDERAPSVVPKLSLANGLVYTYTKEPRSDDVDAWYLTALSFRTGERVYKRLAGTGLGFNNNYAPISIGRNGAAYVGVLGGLVMLRDGDSPSP